MCIKDASLVLCNDKSNSFGAPDVLQANADRLIVRYTIDKRWGCACVMRSCAAVGVRGGVVVVCVEGGPIMFCLFTENGPVMFCP